MAFLSIYVAFNFVVLVTFFASVPFVFEFVYRSDRDMTGLVFLGIGIGRICAPPTCILLDRWIWQKGYVRCKREGSLEFVAPEHRLWAAMAGSLGSPTCLLWFVHISSAAILQTNLCQVRTIREGRCLLDPLVHRNATICLVKTLPMRESFLPQQINNRSFCRIPHGHIYLIPTLL